MTVPSTPGFAPTEIYVIDQREYWLVRAQGRWRISASPPRSPSKTEQFDDRAAAEAAWWQMIAAALVNHPARLHTAEIDGTTVVLVDDPPNQRIHLAELNGPSGAFAVPFTGTEQALLAWRDRVHDLVSPARPESGTSRVKG